MFRFCSLSSSSNGNCLFIQSNNSKILIDVGISVKKINNELNKINTSLSEIDAILITHEHIDHCKSLESINKNYNIPVYANIETWTFINKQFSNIQNQYIIEFNNHFTINDLKILAFDSPHDSINSCGYTIEYNDKKISIATDMGHITKTVTKNLKNSNFVFLESNYDINMLNVGKYPYNLKRRIASNSGHLSNVQCGECILNLCKNTKNFMLGHLSKENNFPELALKTTENILLENGISLLDLNINVANRDSISKIIYLEN